MPSEPLLFDDLREGQVFTFQSGVSEAEAWLPFVKIGPNEAKPLMTWGSKVVLGEHVDRNCLGEHVSTNVVMCESQYK